MARDHNQMTRSELNSLKRDMDAAYNRRTGKNKAKTATNEWAGDTYGPINSADKHPAFATNPETTEEIKFEYGDKTINVLHDTFYEAASEHCAEKKPDSEKKDLFGMKDNIKDHEPIPPTFAYKKLKAVIDRINAETSASNGVTEKTRGLGSNTEHSRGLGGNDGTAIEQSSCRGACSGICVGSCINHCNGCTGCNSGCNTSCYGNCAKDCTGNCGNVCTSTCKGFCDSCSGSCRQTCGGSCGGYCYRNCTSCSGGCSGGCGNTCTNNCGWNCRGDCAGNNGGTAYANGQYSNSQGELHGD